MASARAIYRPLKRVVYNREARARAISYMMAVLITIAVVAFMGIMLFMMTSGWFRGGGTASISVTGTGTGSQDGRSATINFQIRNTGDAPAVITQIFVEGLGAASPSAPAFAVGGGSVAVSAISAGGSVSVNTGQTAGVTVASKQNILGVLRLSGTGLYPGSELRITVVFYDLSSRVHKVTDTMVSLQ